MGGWVSIHRKILDNPLLNRSRVYSNFEAWIWLLLKANHQDNKFLLGSEIVIVKTGELLTSQKKLCKQFRWGNSKLRNFLKVLQKDEMIEIKVDSKSTRISICNYDTYQNSQIDSKSIVNRKQIADKSLANTNNNVNNSNNVNKKISNDILCDFESFWNKYGKKIDRGGCLSKWKSLSQSARTLILNNLDRYIAQFDDPQFMMHPKSFINYTKRNPDSWVDEIVDKPNGDGKPSNELLEAAQYKGGQ